jgi:hypothetical protein
LCGSIRLQCAKNGKNYKEEPPPQRAMRPGARYSRVGLMRGPKRFSSQHGLKSMWVPVSLEYERMAPNTSGTE